MKNRIQKGLKPFIIRNIAILIGVCYLLHPLHQQINSALHTVSHHMSVPQAILSHDHTNAGSIETHASDDHMTAMPHHEHGIMDFISELFEHSNTDEVPGKTQMRDIKMSKHVLTQFELVLPQDVLQKSKIRVPKEHELLSGCKSEFYPPPKRI